MSFSLLQIVLKELTGIRSVSPLMNHIVKADLTTALSKIIFED